MFYIHQSTCISPQDSFLKTDFSTLVESKENYLLVIEPGYDDIPPNIIRRMSKGVRMGVGASLPLLKEEKVEGIVIGTADGGMEDCISFLNQIIQYKEGMLTPGNFVQGTPNSIAAQVGLISANKGYNSTHVHRGLAFENALIDAAMLSKEHAGKSFLAGAVDELSDANFNMDDLEGWYKRSSFSNKGLYQEDSAGSIAGEGAAMFIINDEKVKATAHVEDISTLHTQSKEAVADRLQKVIKKNLKPGEKIDLLISGENGDNRLLEFYTACETILTGVPVARFKHMSGEYATASSMALWLGCKFLGQKALAPHMIKTVIPDIEFKRILIYNNYKGMQHSFILISKP